MYFRFITLIIVLLFNCQIFSSTRYFTYNETTGNDSHNYTVKIFNENSTIRLEADTFSTICDSLFNTIEYSAIGKSGSKIMSSRRTEKELQLTESSQNKTFNPDPDYWYQTMFNMKDFITSEQRKRVFFLLLDYKCDENNPKHKLKKFVLNKKGEETIHHEGRNVTVYKIEMTLTGLGSKLWKAHFWYRTEDFMLFKFIMKRGGPGTKPTITTFVKEYTIK